MGRKKKLPEDYAKEHENDFEIRVVWKEISGFGDAPIKVPESALVCKFCETFVKPKGSRISEHLISARHSEMKKRTLGKTSPVTSLPASLQLKLEQQNMFTSGLVRTLALSGVCQPSAVSTIMNFVRENCSNIMGDLGILNVNNLIDGYLPMVFNNYMFRELLPTIGGKKLNIFIDNMIDINNIPGVALYVQYYDVMLDIHKMLLLDITPLPVCNTSVIFTYLASFIQKYELNWLNIATISVASLQDINSLAHEVKRQHPHVVIFLSLSTQISEACLSTLSNNLPDLFTFVSLLSTVLSSNPTLNRMYFQTWSENGLQVSQAILPPTVRHGDVVSWVSSAEVILRIWSHVRKFCERYKNLPEFTILRNCFSDLDQLQVNMRRVITYLNPICLMVKALKHGFVTEKINELLTQTLLDLISISYEEVMIDKFYEHQDNLSQKKSTPTDGSYPLSSSLTVSSTPLPPIASPPTGTCPSHFRNSSSHSCSTRLLSAPTMLSNSLATDSIIKNNTTQWVITENETCSTKASNNVKSVPKPKINIPKPLNYHSTVSEVLQSEISLNTTKNSNDNHKLTSLHSTKLLRNYDLPNNQFILNNNHSSSSSLQPSPVPKTVPQAINYLPLTISSDVSNATDNASNTDYPVDSEDCLNFMKSFKDKMLKLLADCKQTNILGSGGFFERFSIFNPAKSHTHDVPGKNEFKRDFEYYEPVLKLFCTEEWNSEIQKVMKQELEAYFIFISTTQLNLDSLTYWKLLKRALPNLGNSVLSALGLITGKNKPLIKSIILRVIEDPECLLSFDNIIRLSIMNFNQHS